MEIAAMEEPIFSRQEQGVVYLFSRYWTEIEAFKNKRITEIQVRFPDATARCFATI
jgi:hypothetical protein